MIYDESISGQRHHTRNLADPRDSSIVPSSVHKRRYRESLGELRL